MGLIRLLKNIKEYNEEQFEKEANKWGLTKKEKEAAKRDRMTPEEYLEAEERDDDNLD